MKEREEYTKGIGGKELLIDLEATIDKEKQKEIKAFIESYKKDIKAGNDVSKYLTQSLYYCEHIQKRRQEKFNVSVEEGYAFNKMKAFNDDGGLWLYDGKNVACNYCDEEGVRYRNYKIGNSKKLKVKEKRYSNYSVISNATGKTGTIKCPNCGHTCSQEDFFTHCPFCNTKFNIEDYQNRISGTSLSLFGKNLSSGTTRFIFFSVMILCVALNQIYGFIGGDTIPGRFFAGLLLFLIAMAVFLILTLPFYLRPIRENKKKRSIGIKMYEYDKYFSQEQFYSIVDYRLNVWAFAEPGDHVLQLVNNYHLDEEQIIDLDIVSYKDVILREGNDNLSIQLKCQIRFIYMAGNTIRSKTEDYSLVLARNKKVQTNLESDVLLLKCEKCGASISLLEGGQCNYCRSPIDVLNYDWVLMEIIKQ